MKTLSVLSSMNVRLAIAFLACGAVVSACQADEESAEGEPAEDTAVSAASAKPDYPAIPGAKHSVIDVNNIKIHVAEMGEGPLVLLLHGFPELWYSWRNQLPALADAGYHAVAFDLRGFGGTSAPPNVEAYRVDNQCGDIAGLIDYFGSENAVVVGHDWGAAVTFYCAQIIPEKYRGMVTLSVPYAASTSETPPLTRLRESYGENFFYMLYFQMDEAEAELNARTRELFEKLMVTPGTPREEAVIKSSRADAGGFLDRIGYPKAKPEWMSDEELDFYVKEYERTGFRGGLNYYRSLDANWAVLRELGPQQLLAESIFIGGEKDFLLGGKSKEELEKGMRTVTPNITAYVLPDTGHWIQNERASEVNAILLGYLKKVADKY